MDPVEREGRCGALGWAACATAYPGETRSGDAFLVEPTPTGALVAVVDGLGHGEEAADVAGLALASLQKTAGLPLVDCLMACHSALRDSRGAAVTLVEADFDHLRLTWIAVGNVEAAVVRPGRDGAPSSRWSVPLRGGVVGYRLPSLRESTAVLGAGDTLVAATDGLSRAFVGAADPSPSAPALARRLHRDYARSDDDALVLVARGTGPNRH